MHYSCVPHSGGEDMTVARGRVLAIFVVAALMAGSGFLGWYLHPDQPASTAQTAGSPALNSVEGQATLPVSNQAHEIKDLKIGQTAYTVPWAMREDYQRRAGLAPTTP